jgi:hypothetical protein
MSLSKLCLYSIKSRKDIFIAYNADIYWIILYIYYLIFIQCLLFYSRYYLNV